MHRTIRHGVATFCAKSTILTTVVRMLISWFAASCLIFCGFASFGQGSPGLVGRWDFDDGTGRDTSGSGQDALLGDAEIYSLGGDHSCLRMISPANPMRIATPVNSPLAIAHGTVSLWLNLGWSDNVDVLAYSNKSILFRVYRRHLQPRFRGENKFKFSSGIVDRNWPKYDLRDWAFYPHVLASTGDSEWHQFVLAYDEAQKQIVGWRDGQRIAVIDLSAADIEPLRRQGLKEIVVGEGFVGFIDDIRIYDRVLDDEAVRALYSETQSIYAGRSDTIATDRKMAIYKPLKEDCTLQQAWLQHQPRANSRGCEILKQIVATGENSTVQTAADELASAAKSMFNIQSEIKAAMTPDARVVLGTPETSSWIRERAKMLELDRVQHDGFIIKSVNDGNDRTLVVAANVPAGVIFGTFDLIRRIQMGQDTRTIDALENPRVPIRMVDQWSNFRGLSSDDWYGRKPGSTKNGSRYQSIFSWEDLRTGDTKLIRDWVRMMSSAGWNAISPSEINWISRNNFLDHLDEVATLANICRDYGMKLYWSPSYLLALDPATADALYARVPDFGGYVLKVGSEKQNGDPRPAMINRMADTLKPHGGYAVVRGFVYGNGRYESEPYRNLIPYDVFAAEDGQYRDNVVITPKGSPMDWDFSAPIPALDGAFQKNLSGSELVIDKNWPVSWIEKWKWWLEQDNYRGGPGSLNKLDVDCIMGVSMISPAPAWSVSPLNMVNYYGLGRLAWNPDLSVDEIYSEWICQTFGDNTEVANTIKTILLLSDDVARKLYMYRGYRGVWIDTGDKKDMVQTKSTHSANSRGIGTTSELLQKRTLDQYAPGLRAIYGDPRLGEEYLTSFHFAEYDRPLSNGRTVIQDFYANMDEAVQLAEQMSQLWSGLKGKVDDVRYDATLDALNDFADAAMKHRAKSVAIFEVVSGRKAADVKQELTAENLAMVGVYNVSDFGALPEPKANNAPAINSAIAACSAAGGGTVYVPTGVYGCGTIHLKSNVTLALEIGSVLKALPDAMDPWEPNPHDIGLMDPAYYHWHASIVCGEDVENIKILGPGTLDGTALTRSSKVRKGVGDKAIALKRCRDVEIVNLNIQEGGHYTILATACNGVRIDNVTIKTSRDGLNLSQCQDVIVANCHINAVRYEDGKPVGGDDAIKLGCDYSLGEALPSQNITVRNCYLASGCNALQFGTETAGDFRDIAFENVRILIAGKAGIGVTSNDGGTIENVRFKDITMQKTFVPIFIKVSDVGRVPEGKHKLGAIRDITFENVTATDGESPSRVSNMASVIWGKPNSLIENIVFKNVRIEVKGGQEDSEPAFVPAENDERFPQDVGQLPSYAWYLRNARNVRFIDCDFGWEQPDGRPAIVVDGVDGFSLSRSSIQPGVNGGSPVVVMSGAQPTIDTAESIFPEFHGLVTSSSEDTKGITDAREPEPVQAAIDPKLDPLSISPESGTIYQAEEARLGGAFRENKREGFSGQGYADFNQPAGDFIEWTVHTDKAADHTLKFRYALKKDTRSLELTLNDVVVERSLDFPSTGSWEAWKTIALVVPLKTGANTVRLSTNGHNGCNVDYLSVEAVKR